MSNSNLQHLKNAILKVTQTIEAQIGRGYISPYPFEQVSEAVLLFKKIEDNRRKQEADREEKGYNNVLDFCAAYKKKNKPKFELKKK